MRTRPSMCVCARLLQSCTTLHSPMDGKQNEILPTNPKPQILPKKGPPSGDLIGQPACGSTDHRTRFRVILAGRHLLRWSRVYESWLKGRKPHLCSNTVWSQLF